ncbi:hypothetical protein HDV00_006442 [Rhizophlyctis rosea]|nr:hypothetical protein HDV00_006442 [Rhizophlyctis rosea]
MTPKQLTQCLLIAAAGIGLVNAQKSTQYCSSSSGLCYASYTATTSNITTRIAIPAVAQPDEFLLQLIGPPNVGWVGTSLAGRMTYALLVVAWPDGKNVRGSVRYTAEYQLPQPLSGPVLTVLPDSTVNSTHFYAHVRCQKCGSWKNMQNGMDHLASNGTSTWAYAMSGTPVNDPSNVDTTFNIHTTFGMWGMQMDQARNDDYAGKVAKLLKGGTTTTTATTTTTTRTTTPTPTPTPTSCTFPSPVHPFQTAPNWTANTIIKGLTSPRGITMDKNNNLLVIQSGVGLTGHRLSPTSCVLKTKTILARAELNHGIALSADGKTLYVSSRDIAWRFSYDADTMTVSNEQTVITGMSNSDHITRTILTFSHHPSLIAISRGSDSNIDDASFSKDVARAAVKVFNVPNVPAGGYDYATGGKFLGYGLRNEVGLMEDWVGDVWGVENSADDLVRRAKNGTEVDVHQDNPAEKLNYLGNPSKPTSAWYGYPYCYTIWDPSTFPTDQPYTVGQPFVQRPNKTINDTLCTAAKPPTLLFQPHSAPLDIKLNPSAKDTSAYVTFHGSWNRDPPTGYKVVSVPGRKSKTGGWEPLGNLQSKEKRYEDLLWNQGGAEGCGSGSCFRPVGLAWSADGRRLFVSSDATGEVFVLRRRMGSGSTTVEEEETTGVPTETTTIVDATTTEPVPTTTTPSRCHRTRTERAQFRTQGLGKPTKSPIQPFHTFPTEILNQIFNNDVGEYLTIFLLTKAYLELRLVDKLFNKFYNLYIVKWQ